MEKKIVKAKGAPAPVGPYNQAVVIGNLVYTAGQIPLDPVSGQMVGANAGEQAQQQLHLHFDEGAHPLLFQLD